MTFRSTRTRSSGISVVEILVALGVLVVIISFTAPSLSKVNARAELDVALENVNLSVYMARNTARQLETDVIMHLETGRHEQQHSISFSFPTRNAELDSGTLLQDFQFPAGIRLVTDDTSIHFDSRGMVEVPVHLLIVSSLDEGVNERLVIE